MFSVVFGKNMEFFVFLLLFTSTTSVEGAITIMADKIQIRCVHANETIESFKKINQTTLSTVEILYCAPPKESYKTALQNLNINTDRLKELRTSVMDIKVNKFVKGRKLTVQYQTIITETSARFAYFIAFINTTGDAQMDSIGRMCSGDAHSNLLSILPFKTINTKHITLSLSCPGQKYPYINLFKKININYDLIEKLHLNYFEYDREINATVLDGLNLTELNVVNEQIPSEYEDGFFDSQLKTLKILYVRNINLKPLPANGMTDVVLIGASSYAVFGDCSSLERLEVSQWTVHLNTGWIEKCLKLNTLTMYQMTEENIARALREVKLLTSLSITSAAMIRLSENLLSNLTLLRNLTISKVRLQKIDQRSLYENEQLHYVDFSGNVLDSGFNLISSVQDSKTIEYLDASNNQNLNLCVVKGHMDPTYKAIHQYSVLPPLKTLFLNFTGMTEICFRYFKKLTYLDLSKNNIRRLEFEELPSYDNQSLTINLANNPITIPNSEKDYKMMLAKFKNVKNITIYLDILLDCDCQYAWYAKALRSLPQLNINADCRQGPLKTISTEHLECTKNNCDSCICRTSWKTNKTEADCDDRGLSSLPKLPDDVNAVVASNNLIHSLNRGNFRPNIKSIDLRRNYISGISPEIVPLMFENNRDIWMAGNPIICDCTNQEFVLAVQRFQDQVKDYNNLTCADGSTRIKHIDGYGLCKAEKERRFLVMAASIGTLLALFALCGVLGYKYKQEIKVFLFARGYCLWFLREDSLDSHKLFDAFISFCHQDEEFVATELLPYLETGYSLCIHTRHFIPGEMISTQIIRSVDSSRRTIIVLSKNFVSSVWGMMEFKTAHISALREGRARVIVIVLDDVINDEDIDEELKRYLKTNTYLKWGDHLFWDKLKYALPHYPRTKIADSQNELDEMTPVVSTPESSSIL